MSLKNVTVVYPIGRKHDSRAYFKRFLSPALNGPAKKIDILISSFSWFLGPFQNESWCSTEGVTDGCPGCVVGIQKH